MIKTVARDSIPELSDPRERICSCPCRRSIAHKRADAISFDAGCRQRLARDRGRPANRAHHNCQCGPGALATVDEDGYIACSTCGHTRKRVSAPINGFDAIQRLMATDGDGQPLYLKQRPRRPSRWRDWQPATAPRAA